MGESGRSERLGGGGEASPPARRKKVIGVTPIRRKSGKEVYAIAFSFRGVQCRETVSREHSKASETYCVRLRAEILRKIELGQFKYTDYFPDAKRAALFGHGNLRSKTIGERLEAYRDRTKATLEASTWAPYKRDIENVLIPWCGHMQIAAFKPSDLREFVGLQTVTLKRLRNMLLPLRAVFAEAMEDGDITTNPLATVRLAKLVPLDKRTSDYEPRPYSVAELKILLAKLPEPERWLFQFWAFTGMRTGELIGLRWARIDLEAKTVRVTETTTLGLDKPRAKTKSGLRTIPLLPAALEAVTAMRPHTQLAGGRFTINPRAKSDGKAWQTNLLERMWKSAHKGTGIAERTPYELRHTFASQLLSQGENPALIAKLLGHKTIEMVTRSYGRWISEGEQLGFDRPPRRYGMEPLWAGEIHASLTSGAGEK